MDSSLDVEAQGKSLSPEKFTRDNPFQKIHSNDEVTKI
jgi:hypothetical protein